MPATNPGIDAYIEKSLDFAKPILRHIRKLVHIACPQAEEKIKWGMPHFDYRGEMMCSMAAFKQHCVMSFWKGILLKDEKGVLDVHRTEAMGQFGKITGLEDLPPDEIIMDFIHQAMQLNEQGIKLPSKPSVRNELAIPPFFLENLETNPAAKVTFENFSNSNKKEYVEWINEAKTEATRQKRMAQALEWMSEGKIRNWKYVKNSESRTTLP